MLCEDAAMLVHGAIIPPRTVVEAVAAVVRSVPEPAQAVAAASPRSRLGRLGRHRTHAESPVADPVMLEHVPIDDMRLPITGFGNLTTTDAHRLADELRT